MNNNLKECLEILKSIGADSSRIAKEHILKENKDNQLLKDILFFLYNPYIVTGINTKKLNKKVKLEVSNELDTIIDVMNFLKVNNTGTDEYIKIIQNWIANQDLEYQDVLKQLVTKSLKIGITAKTINKIHKNFIPEFNVMLAEKYYENTNKVNGEFIITTKLDGNRMVLVKENGTIKLFSRQGQLIEGLVDIIKDAKQLQDNIVYDGEVLLKNDRNLDSKQLFQETQKIIRKKDIKKTNLIFNIFDMMPLDEFKQGVSTNDTLTRKNQLHALLDSLKLDWVKEVPILYAGTNKNRIDELLNEAIKNGEEGIMINLANGKYQCKRTKELLKVKIMNSADCKIIGYEEGTGRNEGVLGAFLIDYKGHNVKVGSGYTDEDRKMFWENKNNFTGKIMEVQYFEETKNQNGGISLRFPVYKCIRNDKIEPSYF
ncbi:RNA ligase family protein [Clostridium sporogenes]|uniref:ATP-dependent DNA ligase n=1 Tax=Clostridium sporogenes TaxID=1509 RepID=UPI0013D0DB76|nr:RNA ligase family protein [Clostridium sporogenes]NFH40772.1 ATP-dependent DNA ligase [Clostridium sporogenes]